MTRVLLLRHASHGLLNRVLAGRMEGVALSEAGRAEAALLAGRLAGMGVAALCCSPLDRTRETAGIVAGRLGLAVETMDDLSEIDFGEWTGLGFDALHQDPRWHAWNSHRSGTRPPGGESMAEAQLRIVVALERLRARHPDATVAAVTHGDVIKAAVAYLLGVPLDLFHRIEIGPASLSIVDLGADWARVAAVNDTGHLSPGHLAAAAAGS